MRLDNKNMAENLDIDETCLDNILNDISLRIFFKFTPE